MRALSTPGLALPLLLLALGAAPAQGHGGLPETSNIAVRNGHPADLFVGATFGALVSRDGGQSWRWICSEALGHAGWAPETYLWQAGGALLAATSHELLRSHDGGCSWQVHPFFQEKWPTSLASHPSEEARLWVVTGRPAAANALYRSDDGGETFTATALQRPDATFTSVKVAPSDPRRLYVSGTSPEGLRLYRSDDTGANWEELPQPLSELAQPYELVLLLVAENDPDRLWARVASQGLMYFLESRDGGRTLQRVLPLNDIVVGAEASADGNTVWIATYSTLYRSRGGEAPQPLSLPAGNTCARRAGNVLYACGSTWAHGWALGKSLDEGDTWEPLFELPELQGVHTCPAGTPTHDICEARWPQFAQLIGAQVPDAGTPAPDAGTDDPTPLPQADGCGCLTPTGSGLSLAWVLTFALLRRSRRSNPEP